MMKIVLFVVSYLFISNAIIAQYNVDNVFRKYKNDSGVSSWQYKGNLSDLFQLKHGEEFESKMENLQFYMFDEVIRDISEFDQKQLKKAIAIDDYETLLQAKSENQDVQILGIFDGDIIQKVFMHIKFQERNFYIFLTGNISLNDLQKIDLEKLMIDKNWD